MTNDLHSFLKDQEKEITNAIEGKTLIDYINRNAEEYGNYPALNTPANNEYSAWDSMSWSELREEVKNWFVKDVSSPYMEFVIDFKEEVRDKVPAVCHENGSARLQSVTKNDNKWYHNFLTKWHVKSGVPILLNTSFNDREPIVETPYDAVNCFLGTDIDAVYFRDAGLLVTKEKIS